MCDMKKLCTYDAVSTGADYWKLELLKRMPDNARMSDFRRLFGQAKSIGVKDIKSLNREIWQIDDTFFVVFETRIEDFGLEDPKISGQPTLHSFTFVKKLPTLEEMIDHSR